MIIIATFIGTDFSLGYRTGKDYKLTISGKWGFSIERTDDGTGQCAYESLKSFLKNWTNVRTDYTVLFKDNELPVVYYHQFSEWIAERYNYIPGEYSGSWCAKQYDISNADNHRTTSQLWAYWWQHIRTI